MQSVDERTENDVTLRYYHAYNNTEFPDRLLELLQQFPQKPAAVLSQLKQETGTEMSRSTLKQIARAAGLMWKRM